MSAEEPWTLTISGLGDPTAARAIYHETIDRLRQQGQVVVRSQFETESENGAVGSHEAPEPHPVRKRQQKGRKP